MQGHEWLSTFPQLPASLQCRVYRHCGVQNPSRLPETLLPGHMVWQLAQAIGHAAKINAAIPLPGSPCSSPIVTPGPQSIRMCLRVDRQESEKVCTQPAARHINTPHAMDFKQGAKLPHSRLCVSPCLLEVWCDREHAIPHVAITPVSVMRGSKVAARDGTHHDQLSDVGVPEQPAWYSRLTPDAGQPDCD